MIWKTDHMIIYVENPMGQTKKKQQKNKNTTLGTDKQL